MCQWQWLGSNTAIVRSSTEYSHSNSEKEFCFGLVWKSISCSKLSLEKPKPIGKHTHAVLLWAYFSFTRTSKLVKAPLKAKQISFFVWLVKLKGNWDKKPLNPVLNPLDYSWPTYLHIWRGIFPTFFVFLLLGDDPTALLWKGISFKYF